MVYAVMQRLGSIRLLALLVAAPGVAGAAGQPDLPELPVQDEPEAGAESNTDPPEAGPEVKSLEDLLLPKGQSSGGGKPAAGDRAEEAQKYRECLDMAKASPQDAVDFAYQWQAGGGTLAAKHCNAVAFVELERFALAADRLSDIVRDLRTGRNFPDSWLPNREGGRLIGQLYAQLGNAWLMAGKPGKAYTALSEGLADTPESAESARLPLRIDRARAAAAQGDYEASLEDLQTARKRAPRRGDIALYMASAHRKLGALEKAMQAVKDAIEADGESPTALLERANIHMLMNEPTAARYNWNKVVENWPDSAAASAAETNLDRLDRHLAGSGGEPDG